MTEILIGRHAVDVGGGNVVEPGQPIPDDADPDIVKQMRKHDWVYDDAEESKKKGS
jgi:hypothetical protein